MVATALEQQYENDIAQAARELGQQEQLNLQMARQAYQELNPMPPAWVEPVFNPGKWEEPIYKEPTFMQIMGVQATAMTLSVIGSVLLSAFTVGLVLYISAVNTDVRLIEQTNSAFLDFISTAVPALFFVGGMVAVEGYAFSHEYAVGKKDGQINFSPIPLRAAYAIMITTGLLRSLGLVDADFLTTYPALNLISQAGVILSLTFGIPILIGYGARNLGVFRNQFEAYKKENKKTFDAQRQKDYDEFIAKEDERRATFWEKRNADMEEHQLTIKAWFDGFRKYWEQSYSGKVLGIDRAAPTRTRAVKVQKEVSTAGPTDAVRSFLKQNGWYPDQIGANEGQIAPAQLCDAMTQQGIAGFGQNEEGRKQISTFLFRLRQEQKKAKVNGNDWLTL